MPTRRTVTMLMTVASLLVPAGALAQGKAAPTEASLRQAIDHYVATWNRHDVKAWSALLTDDVWYTEADDFYQRMKGRPAVITFFGDIVKTSDLKWEVTRVKMMPNGTATVVLRYFALILPKKNGKYASTFESTPSLSRWRLEGDRWRMFYFTSLKGAALAEMKKDGVE